MQLPCWHHFMLFLSRYLENIKWNTDRGFQTRKPLQPLSLHSPDLVQRPGSSSAWPLKHNQKNQNYKERSLILFWAKRHTKLWWIKSETHTWAPTLSWIDLLTGLWASMVRTSAGSLSSASNTRTEPEQQGDVSTNSDSYSKNMGQTKTWRYQGIQF